MKSEDLSGSKVLTGNQACAYGTCLCRPDVIAAYPITPQTTILEELARFGDEGILSAEFIAVEGENTAIGSCIGASAAGGRTFTATSSNGLAFMYDGYVFAAGNRLPIVMALAMRDQVAPHCVSAGQQDAIMVKDQGWIQLFAESCQEILDMMIMAYRLAEDENVLIPVNVCFEGFFLSYMSQNVDVPDFATVDRFLKPLETSRRQTWSIEKPMGFSSYATENLFMTFRTKHAAAFNRSKDKFDKITKEFSTLFGRDYGGQIEEYKTGDADAVIIMMGASAGTAKSVIDAAREKGKKIGLIRIRMFRPFPKDALAQAMAGKKAVGVLDRNINCGWDSGHGFMELAAVQHIFGLNIPMSGYVDGLAGADIPEKHIERVIDETLEVAAGKKKPKPIIWLALE
jgi:pyruvate ferredoxin oxidoreductase alpha subunit